MELNEYQDKAMSTCMSSSDNFAYMMLNLVGEVSELASKVAKHIRKDEFGITSNGLAGNYLTNDKLEEYENSMKLEVSDICWQVAGLCKVMGWTLEEVCQANIDKLSSRKDRNVIEGNGDNR